MSPHDPGPHDPGPHREAPTERLIDLMLTDYERAVALRYASERELGPVVGRLRARLERWNTDGSGVAQTRAARGAFVSALHRWEPRLREWLTIRDTGARLEPAVPHMTDAQWERFSTLQLEEMARAAAGNPFDTDHRRVRDLLLRFEEFSEPPDGPAQAA